MNLLRLRLRLRFNHEFILLINKMILGALALISLIVTVLNKNDYSMSKLTYNNKLSSLEAELHYQAKNFDISKYDIDPIRNKNGINLIKDLKVSISLLCDSIIHITVRDLHQKRWEVPLKNDDFTQRTSECVNFLNLQEYGLTFEKSPFSFSLNYDNITYYTWKGGQFLYSDTLIVFEALLTTDYIFGFGERNAKFKLENGKYTIWPNDTGITYRDQKIGGFNLMGHQPIGLHMVKSDLFVGFIFLNSNAQDVVIKTKRPFTSLEHRTIGGIIDYYIVIGKSADDVILKIHEIVGRPIIPPYWSLGWHHSRWGFNSTQDMINTYKKYREHNIPLDTMWSDIDILHLKRIFQLSRPFNDIRRFIDELHKDNAKYVPIIDYGIPNNLSDPYYKMGSDLGKAFIMSNYTGYELISSSWPGNSIILDLFTENGKKVLKKGLKDFDDLVNYDGIWLDMNEPGIIDVLRNGKGEKAPSYPPSRNKYENLPYIPGYRMKHSDVETKGVSLNGYSILDKEYHTMHNIRPLLVREQIKIVNEYLHKTGRRPFIISRANTFGHGKHSFHWLGDNFSSFNDMKDSISGTFVYNIFGVPMTGADICGFNGNTTDELCARWHVLGAMYPFSRNHNTIYLRKQEPWEFPRYTLSASTIAIRTKYSLIRYMYSQLYMISLGEKGSFFKPAFFEFPNDQELLSHIEDTVMVGTCFYFVPNFDKSQNDYIAYFPNSNWNYFPSGEELMSFSGSTSNGIKFLLPGKFDVVNLFLRGGSIVPYQNISYPSLVKTTHDLRLRPTELIINPDENYFAEGEVFFDNDDKDSLENKDFLYVKINYVLDVVYFTRMTNFITDYPYEDIYISKITVYRHSRIQSQLKEQITNCGIILGNSDIITKKAISDPSIDMIVIDLTDSKISFNNIQSLIFN